MKEIVRYGIILSLICVIASAALALTNNLTSSRISAQSKAEEEAGLKEVVPGAERFEPATDKGEVIYYRAYDKDNKFIAVAFKALGKGYSSNIETIAGMGLDGVIGAVKVLSQNETPGLGSRVTESSFTGQFGGKNVQGLDTVQAITGATISSRAVIKAVETKALRIKELMKNAR
jgi:electron transport complex protein RnfG